MFCAIIDLRVSLLTLCPTSGSLPLIVGLFYAKRMGWKVSTPHITLMIYNIKKGSGRPHIAQEEL